MHNFIGNLRSKVQVAPADAQVTVVNTVTIIDGTGGAPRHDATLIVDGDRIRAIAAASAPGPRPKAWK